MKKQRKSITNRCKSISKKWWFQTIINALITTVISTGVYWVCDALKPTSPQVELQMQKDSMFIELAQELTGKHDTQTVERVKHDVLSYLSRTLSKYPTREEFAREKHQFIDKVQGVIWESKMENGNMSIYAVAPYTNKAERCQ